MEKKVLNANFMRPTGTKRGRRVPTGSAQRCTRGYQLHEIDDETPEEAAGLLSCAS